MSQSRYDLWEDAEGHMHLIVWENVSHGYGSHWQPYNYQIQVTRMTKDSGIARLGPFCYEYVKMSEEK